MMSPAWHTGWKGRSATDARKKVDLLGLPKPARVLVTMVWPGSHQPISGSVAKRPPSTSSDGIPHQRSSTVA
jgi:hypothetical protein